MNHNRIYLLFLACLLLIGCGGSTQGTGGVTVRGRVLEVSGTPAQGVDVTVISTGDSSVSDAAGSFEIITARAPTIELLFEDNQLSALSTISEIDQSVDQVSSTFTVNRTSNSVAVNKVEFERDRDDGNGGNDLNGDNGNSQENDHEEGDGGGSNDDNDNQDESNDADDSSDDSNSGGDDDSPDDSDDSSSDSTSDNENSGGDSSDGSSGSSGSDGPEDGPDEGETIEEQGPLTALSNSGVTVNGRTFTPTLDTEYRLADESAASLGDFNVGQEVKARGKATGGVLVLTRLELED